MLSIGSVRGPVCLAHLCVVLITGESSSPASGLRVVLVTGDDDDVLITSLWLGAQERRRVQRGAWPVPVK
jgi:hypothetical protein